MPPADASAEPGTAPDGGSTGVEDTLDLRLTEELLAMIAEERGSATARTPVPSELLCDPGSWPPARTTAGSSPSSPSGPNAISPCSAAG